MELPLLVASRLVSLVTQSLGSSHARHPGSPARLGSCLIQSWHAQCPASASSSSRSHYRFAILNRLWASVRLSSFRTSNKSTSPFIFVSRPSSNNFSRASTHAAFCISCFSVNNQLIHPLSIIIIIVSFLILSLSRLHFHIINESYVFLLFIYLILVHISYFWV